MIAPISASENQARSRPSVTQGENVLLKCVPIPTARALITFTTWRAYHMGLIPVNALLTASCNSDSGEGEDAANGCG
jgi:hypothetical protein